MSPAHSTRLANTASALLALTLPPLDVPPSPLVCERTHISRSATAPLGAQLGEAVLEAVAKLRPSPMERALVLRSLLAGAESLSLCSEEYGRYSGERVLHVTHEESGDTGRFTLRVTDGVLNRCVHWCSTAEFVLSEGGDLISGETALWDWPLGTRFAMLNFDGELEPVEYGDLQRMDLLRWQHNGTAAVDALNDSLRAALGAALRDTVMVPRPAEKWPSLHELKQKLRRGREHQQPGGPRKSHTVNDANRDAGPTSPARPARSRSQRHRPRAPRRCFPPAPRPTRCRTPRGYRRRHRCLAARPTRPAPMKHRRD